MLEIVPLRDFELPVKINGMLVPLALMLMQNYVFQLYMQSKIKWIYVNSHLFYLALRSVFYAQAVYSLPLKIFFEVCL